MDKNIANKRKLKKALVVFGCVALLLACILIMFFIKLPITDYCDGGCNIGELKWMSIADIVIDSGPEVLSSLYITLFMLGLTAFVGLFYNPGLVILFSIIMISLIVMPIVAIIKTVKYCKNTKK